MSNLTIIPHEAWESPAQPVSGPQPVRDEIEAVVYHYPGSQIDQEHMPKQLRSLQASYLRDRGYSLGYCWAIGNGGVYEVRGLDFRNAANNGVPTKSGTLNYNRKTVSVLFAVDGNDQAPAVDFNKAADLHVRIEKELGRTLRVEGHGDKDSTPCPGTGITAQLPYLRLAVAERRQPPPAPQPLPPFDPANRQYGLWPFHTSKPTIKGYSNGDVVRYGKGVLKNELARFLLWFAVAPGYEDLSGPVEFHNPADDSYHRVERRALMQWAHSLCIQLDPNDPWFNGIMHDAVLCSEAALSDCLIDGRQMPHFNADGAIDPLFWGLLDSVADQTWV